jgi:hypothetical protein
LQPPLSGGLSNPQEEAVQTESVSQQLGHPLSIDPPRNTAAPDPRDSTVDVQLGGEQLDPSYQDSAPYSAATEPNDTRATPRAPESIPSRGDYPRTGAAPLLYQLQLMYRGHPPSVRELERQQPVNTAQRPRSSSHGILQGTIEPSPLRARHERTGSGLY